MEDTYYPRILDVVLPTYLEALGALIEIKLGSRQIEQGAKHLISLSDLIKEKNETSKGSKIQEPSLLMVLTGGEFAYKRKDGVFVIPIGCLKD